MNNLLLDCLFLSLYLHVIFVGGIANDRQDKFIDEPSEYEILASNGKYDKNRGGTKIKISN
jgi:hypothetical protein